MKSQNRLKTILITLLLLLLVSACTDKPKALIANKNITTQSNERVDIVASNAVAYSWKQISGIEVVLINANTDTLSFIAPIVQTKETLVFELEALMPSVFEEKTIRKERATVTVHPLEIVTESNETDISDETDTTDVINETNTTDISDETNTTDISDETNTTDISDETNTTDISDETNTTNTSNETNTTNISDETNTTNSIKSIALTVDKTSLKLDENTTLNAIATYNDNTTKDVTDKVEWLTSSDASLKINSKNLKTLKEVNTLLQAQLNSIVSNSVAIEIYKEINGHRLPPEPDETLNNATLLGIDSNNNGVRDDVERYVIIRFSKEEFPKTRTALAMQYAWAMQKIIESPTRESAKYINDSIDCEYYWFDKKQETQWQQFSELLKIDRLAAAKLNSKLAKWQLKHAVFTDKGINGTIFNTRERTKQDFAFNGAMSGGMYPGRDESLDNCQVNIDLFGE